MERPATLLIDTGPLYAAADRDDLNHGRCETLLADAPGSLRVPALAIAAATHLMATRLHPDAELRFLAELALGNVTIEPVHPSDWLRIAQLVEQYRDLPLGTVDASIVAAAERLGVSTIATLDRRHLSVVRPKHMEAFELLP